MSDLKGKIALVTGAGAGIGRAIAEEFASQGAVVCSIEIDRERADDLKRAIEVKGADASIYVGDVRMQDDVDRAMSALKLRYGRLDVLVNNVGNHLLLKPFELQSDDEWEAVYDINLRQMFRVTRAAIPLMKRAGLEEPLSSIINISSIEAFRGIPLTSVYSSCKHAITGFTRCLALELGPAGVRVNAIAMETTETATITPSRYVAEEDRHYVRTWFPLGRFGRPEDMAGCAVFLASEKSAWMTGATVNIDGGALAAGAWYRDLEGVWTNAPIIARPGFSGNGSPN